MGSSNAFESAKSFENYMVGFAVSIITMLVLKGAWMLIKKFTVKVMMKLDDVGGFAQQLQAKSRRQMIQRTNSLNPDDHPEPKIYVLCIVMHDKSL